MPSRTHPTRLSFSRRKSSTRLSTSYGRKPSTHHDSTSRAVITASGTFNLAENRARRQSRVDLSGHFRMSSAMPAYLTPMLGTLLETGKWSDLVIKCRGKEWKVHRAIVCLVSKPLAAALEHSFKESLSGEIAFEDEDSNTVDRFLKFLYSGDYCDNATIATAKGATQTITGVSEALLNNTKVYVMAGKYDVPALKEHAAKKFTLALPREGMTASFLSSLKLMYEETPDSDKLLRSAAMKFVGENFKDLVKNAEFEELCTAHWQSPFFDAIKVVTEFAAREHEPKTCPYCHSTENTRTCTVSEKANNYFGLYYCDGCGNTFD